MFGLRDGSITSTYIKTRGTFPPSFMPYWRENHTRYSSTVSKVPVAYFPIGSGLSLVLVLVVYCTYGGPFSWMHFVLDCLYTAVHALSVDQQ